MSFGNKILENIIKETESWYYDKGEKYFYAYSPLGMVVVYCKNNIEFQIRPTKDKTLSFNVDYDESLINKIISAYDKTTLNYSVNDEEMLRIKQSLKEILINNNDFKFSSMRFQDTTTGPFTVKVNNLKEESFRLDYDCNIKKNDINENDLIKVSYFYTNNKGKTEFIDFHYFLREFENSKFINERYTIVKTINNEKDLFNIVNKLQEENAIKISNYYLNLELDIKNKQNSTVKNKI